MSYETENLARVIAEGFFAVYVKPSGTAAEMQSAIANLTSVLQSAYAHGLNRDQMEFASKLISTIGNRSEVPATELIELASVLKP